MINTVYGTPESMNLVITAQKSLLSDYSLRTRQAEEMTNQLLQDRIPTDVMLSLVTSLMNRQSDIRAVERAVQQQAILQALVLNLSQIQHLKNLPAMQAAVNSCVEQITLSLGHMNPSSN